MHKLEDMFMQVVKYVEYAALCISLVDEVGKIFMVDEVSKLL